MNQIKKRSDFCVISQSIPLTLGSPMMFVRSRNHVNFKRFSGKSRLLQVFFCSSYPDRLSLRLAFKIKISTKWLGWKDGILDFFLPDLFVWHSTVTSFFHPFLCVVAWDRWKGCHASCVCGFVPGCCLSSLIFWGT